MKCPPATQRLCSSETASVASGAKQGCRLCGLLCICECREDGGRDLVHKLLVETVRIVCPREHKCRPADGARMK